MSSFSGPDRVGYPTPLVPSGQFLVPLGSGSSSAVGWPLYNTAVLTPLDVGVSQSFDRIGCNVTTLATGVAVARLGLYGDNGQWSAPLGAPLVDAGTLDLTTTLGDLLLTVALSLGVGRYWAAFVVQGSPTGAPALTGISNAVSLNRSASLGNNNGGTRTLGLSGVTAALPTITAASGLVSNNGTVPQVGLRAA